MADNYSTLRNDFQWHVPRDLNIAVDCCLKWAQLPSHDKKVALTWRPVNEDTQQITFSQMGQLVCQLANGMQRLGVIPGDRVMVLLGRPIEALAVIMACWATGAVAVPLSPELDHESLVSKIKQARGWLIFIDDKTQVTALGAIARCPRIQQTVGLDVYCGSVMSWQGLIARQSSHFEPVKPQPSDPALLVWPEPGDPNFAAGTALMLAQQALIGNLPGFVMTTNWFPDGANGLLTTLLPWNEVGLMAAVLPALYFGQSVTIDQRTEFVLGHDISHVITTPTRWCQWLKPRLANSNVSTATTAIQPLKAVTLIGHAIAPFWREVTEEQVATAPNLALYGAGYGLALGQNNERWPNFSDANALNVIPGFDVKIAKPEAHESSDDSLGRITVARMGAKGHANPAQYVQVWPLKESLDGSGLAPPPTWFETTWLAQAIDEITLEVFESPSSTNTPNVPLTIGPRRLSFTVAEQLLIQIPAVSAAIVMLSPQKKSTATLVVWILLQIHPDYQPLSAITRHELEQTVPGLILEAAGYKASPTESWPTMRVGVVNNIERTHLDQPLRHVWTKRAKFAEIDFLLPSRQSH